jgi:hypothetical protein
LKIPGSSSSTYVHRVGGRLGERAAAERPARPRRDRVDDEVDAAEAGRGFRERSLDVVRLPRVAREPGRVRHLVAECGDRLLAARESGDVPALAGERPHEASGRDCAHPKTRRVFATG